MDLDSEDVLAEVAAAFADYEKALVANDVDRILGWFAEGAVRFGVADRQAGLAEQEAWRRAQPPLPPGRTLRETRIAAFGARTAVVTTLFGYPGRAAEGRQSQTWVRLPAGWRIVSAHVSEYVVEGDGVG